MPTYSRKQPLAVAAFFVCPFAQEYVHLHSNVKESSFSPHLYTNMKLLITGGAGFIGSNLCEHFLREGHTVRCLDNFATGKPANILPLLATCIEVFPYNIFVYAGVVSHFLKFS